MPFTGWVTGSRRTEVDCRSDYLEQTGREAELQRAAKLLVFIFEKRGQPDLITKKLRDAAKDYYCNADYVATLCRTLKSLNLDEVEAIVFDAHDATSRHLATWWEEHKRADEVREAKEQVERARIVKKEKILKKLGITEVELKEILK